MNGSRSHVWRCAFGGLALMLVVIRPLAGCDATRIERVPATQLTVTIDAEPQIAAVAKRLRVSISARENGQWTEPKISEPDVDLTQLVDVVIVPKDNDASRKVQLVVEALDAQGVVLVQERLIKGFQAGVETPYTMSLRVCEGRDLGYVCEQDASCVGAVCRVCNGGTCEPVGMRDVDEEEDPEPPGCEGDECAFRCLDEPRAKPAPEAETATLKVEVFAYRLPFEPVQVLDDVTVSVCVDGEPCRKISASPNPSGQVIVRGLPQGFDGHTGRLTFEREGFLPVDFRPLRPIYDTAWETEPIFMISPKVLAELQRYKKVPVDTDLGAIAARVFDCDNVPASGVIVSTEPTASLLYLDESLLPAFGATKTDATGQAIAFNIDEPSVTVLMRRGRDVLLDLPIEVTPGRLTYVHAYPERPTK